MTMGGPAPAMTIGVISAAQHRERGREYQRGEISEPCNPVSVPDGGILGAMNGVLEWSSGALSSVSARA